MISLPKLPTLRLDGARALVIGASSEIGLGVARVFASAGTDVTIAACQETLLQDIVEAFRSHGWKAAHARLDIGKVEAPGACIEKNGVFDVFVNDVGTSRNGPALETRTEDVDAVMNTNFRVAYFATQAAARALMRHGKPGSLTNIFSQLARAGGVDRAVYSASKYALEGITESMAIK